MQAFSALTVLKLRPAAFAFSTAVDSSFARAPRREMWVLRLPTDFVFNRPFHREVGRFRSLENLLDRTLRGARCP
jgi:hypothetical protein